MSRPLAVACLFLTTMIWGFAFVAQKTAMETMGPLTFAAVRYLLGGLVIMPLALWEYRRSTVAMTPRSWGWIGFLSVVFFLGSWLQQTGLTMTTVTNGGFLTSIYVILVPVLAFLLMRTRPHPILAIAIPLAIGGIFLLNGGSLDALGRGDFLIIACAGFWSLHVLMLGYIARWTGRPIFISAMSFLAAGALAAVGAVLLETPTLAGISAGWVQLAYSAVLSTAVAFTLQAIGQQYVPPANAAVILSAEALFAALGGAIILGERLPIIGYVGAGMIFIAILAVETVPILTRRASEPALLRP